MNRRTFIGTVLGALASIPLVGWLVREIPGITFDGSQNVTFGGKMVWDVEMITMEDFRKKYPKQSSEESGRVYVTKVGYFFGGSIHDLETGKMIAHFPTKWNCWGAPS